MRGMRDLAVGLALVAMAGCGARAALVSDASTDLNSDADVEVTADAPDAPDASIDLVVDAPPADAPPLTGRHVYDVVATLTARPQDGGQVFSPPPETNHFTLVLDADARRILGGGGGSANAMNVTAGPGGSFRFATDPRPFSAAFSVAIQSTLPCMGITSIEYTSMTFVASGTSLTGTAEGFAYYTQGDTFSPSPFTATLVGGPDVTAPRVLSSGSTLVNPLASLFLRVSEPVTASSKARLVAAGGGSVELTPSVRNDADGAIVGFQTPAVVLSYGESYRIDATGVTDFAGLSGSASDETFSTPAVPPLVAEDGFE
jgi:hypothetical protein